MFVMFLKFVADQKMVLSLGNPFAQGLHDGITLCNHKGYESLGIDVIATGWDRNLPICVGLVQKPKRAGGSFDGTDSTAASFLIVC